MTQAPELHMLTGAWAVDALLPEEAAEFETHLRTCQACRQEARELAATAAAIGAAEDAAPPPDLKARILTEARQTRQLPPPGGLHAAIVDLNRRRRSRVMLGVAAAVAAVAIVGGGVVGGVAVHDHHQAVVADRAAAQIAAVLSAPDAHQVSAVTSTGAHATAVVSAAQGEAVFTGSGWAKAPGTHVLQLWVIDATGAHSQGLLTWKAGGSLAPTIARGIPADGAKLGVTVEPAGGSKQPTTTPVVLLSTT